MIKLSSAVVGRHDSSIGRAVVSQAQISGFDSQVL